MPERPILPAAICAAVLLSSASTRAAQVELVSRRHPSFDTAEVVGQGEGAAVSADGRWVAFASSSPNLVPGQSDGNPWPDVFLLDLLSGDLTLVSHAAGFPSTAGVGYSYNPSISADGRYVVFRSGSNNLVPGQASFYFSDNVFLYDRIGGTTTLVSHAAGSATTGGNGLSKDPVISKDGNYVVFASTATNLVAGASDANGKEDVFLYERATGTLTLVSRSAASATTAANGRSWFPVVSADGSFVLYASDATDVAAGQTEANVSEDVFLYGRAGGTNTLVSHAAGLPDTTGNVYATWYGLDISDDGAYAVFLTGATNMVPGQVDAVSISIWNDAFLYERATGAVTLVSHAAGAPATATGAETVAISDDGAWIAFESSGTNLVSGQVDANGAQDVFLYQRATGAVTLVSRQSGTAGTTGSAGHGGGLIKPLLSADGRYVAFVSAATDLVAGQTDPNGASDVFLFDRVAGTTVLASHADGSSSLAGDGESSSYSGGLAADGSRAVYRSAATDLTAETDANGGNDLFVFSRSAGSNAAISFSAPVVRVTPDEGSRGMPSRGGRFVVLHSDATDLVEGQSDAPDTSDVFLVDRVAGTTTLVSHADGSPATAANRESYSPWISADGKWVVFESEATDLIPGIGQPSGFLKYNIFLYGRETGTLTLVSRSASNPAASANGWSSRQVISGDGRYVAFVSAASNLVAGQIDVTGPSGTQDVFVYDRVTGGMALASHTAADPLQAANASGVNQLVGISLDGRWVLFPSLSNNLVPGQTEGNTGNDLFLYDRVTGSVTLVSHSAGSATTTANAATDFLGLPALSADGRYVAFVSAATDLVPGQVDTNGDLDLFLFDRVTGTNTLVSRKSGTAATAGNGRCQTTIWMNDDGRYLPFSCTASDLVPGQTDLNGTFDAFLYDRVAGSVSLLTADGLSTDPGAATFAYGLSPDGRFVAVSSQETLRIPGQSDPNGRGEDLFVLDRRTGTANLASRSLASPLTTANHFSGFSWIAAGGSLLFFSSGGSDLVEGDYNLRSDTYVFSGGPPATEFFTLPPCRVADTRSAGALSSGAAVLFGFLGACGIPVTARAVALNVTVVQGSGDGHLTLYPGDAEPPLSSAINFRAGQTRANNAVLPLAYDGSGTLAVLPSVAGGGTVHVILDVFGWFE